MRTYRCQDSENTPDFSRLVAERCRYTSPIGEALGYLELTIQGKPWIANLYSHVFTIEHQRRRLGPHVGAKWGEGLAGRESMRGGWQ